MKVLVQWATNPPSGWAEVDSENWAILPKKPEPPADRKPIYDGDGKVIGFADTDVIIDDQLGWIHRVCVQGISFLGDHIAIVNRSSFVEVIVWNNDPDDRRKQEFTADVWRLYPDVVERIYRERNETYRFYGFLQERNLFLGSALPRPDDMTSGGKTEVEAYRNFIAPDESLVRHSIWLLDSLVTELNKVSIPGWKDWL